jgi:glycosyltransferase involved in cell wall biosynthesis
MHVLFVHQNFPAQFGHIGAYLIKKLGCRVTFCSERDPGIENGIEKIQYTRRFGATKANSYYTRNFETQVGHAEGVYHALKTRPDIKPDIIVSHSGFGSTLFLREIIDAPILNFFEYFYHPHNSDMDFRPDGTASERKYLRSRVRNAMILLDLENCDAGYTPTQFQHSVLPEVYKPKVKPIFDGVDTEAFHRYPNPPRNINGHVIPPGTRIVTYCSRGFEKMRGFDIFMKAAKIVYQRFPNVVFLVAGTDRICYGGDNEQMSESSLRHHIFNNENYDLSKFIFTGWLSREDLGRMMSLGDCHVYLTVPFVLSWSMMNALSCGAVVIGSNTAPVVEMIRPGETGFLADFFNPEEFADRIIDVLKDPPAFNHVRENAQKMIQEKYSLEAVLPQMLDLYKSCIKKGTKPDDRPAEYGNTRSDPAPQELVPLPTEHLEKVKPIAAQLPRLGPVDNVTGRRSAPNLLIPGQFAGDVKLTRPITNEQLATHMRSSGALPGSPLANALIRPRPAAAQAPARAPATAAKPAPPAAAKPPTAPVTQTPAVAKPPVPVRPAPPPAPKKYPGGINLRALTPPPVKAAQPAPAQKT